MNQLIIVSNYDCQNCGKLKDFLEFYDIPFREVSSADPGAREMLARYRLNTVPQVFLGNELFIPGGYRTMKSMRPDEIKARIESLSGHISSE